MFVYAEISEESTNSSLPTMVPFLMFDSTLIAYPTTISLPILTSRMDSIVTPWGQFQSPFMQEGIPIASFRFQQVMVTIFEDFLEWMIVIIDNLLILAHDYQDLYNKKVLVIRRCIKHNVFLKFEKSYLSKNMQYICSREKIYKLLSP